MPPASRVGARCIVTTVVALFLRVPEFTSCVATVPRFVDGAVDGRIVFLAFLIRLAFQGRVGETIVVAVRPLGAFLLALDLRGVDETIALGPFGRAVVVLVVSYVLLQDMRG